MNEFAQRITQLRKERAMTQEQLAQELGITAQAVSKWENGQSYPDILLLPKLAEVYGVRVDELLGCAPEKDEDEAPALALPWSDESNTIHAVLFAGHTLIGEKDVTNCPEASRISFQYEGGALNIRSYFAVNCEAVQGNVTAGGSVNCDNVEGNVSAGGNITCDSIEGNASAVSINCDSIGGEAASAGKGKHGRKGRDFSFSFDGRELGRTMEEFGRKMGALGEELGQQINKKIAETFDGGAVNGKLAQKFAEKFDGDAENDEPVDLDALDEEIDRKMNAAFGGDFKITDEEDGE